MLRNKNFNSTYSLYEKDEIVSMKFFNFLTNLYPLVMLPNKNLKLHLFGAETGWNNFHDIF